MIIASLYLSMVQQTKVNSYHNYIHTCFADHIISQMGKVSNKMLLLCVLVDASVTPSVEWLTTQFTQCFHLFLKGVSDVQ